MELSAFPKIFSLGMPECEGLFEGEVELTEKIDGSQFAFGRINGELKMRSKGAIIHIGAPPALFKPAHDHVLRIEDRILDNTVMWGETLCKPKHNIIAYSRVPLNHIVLFGAQNLSTGKFLDYGGLGIVAHALEIDVVPLMEWDGEFSLEKFKELLQKESYLGNSTLEGIVVKNYAKGMYRGNIAIPILCGKYVSEAFKERLHKEWRSENTGKGRFEKFLEAFAAPARWLKSIQHLRERGELTNSPKDIGPLIAAIKNDVLEEDAEYCKVELLKIFKEDIERASIKGFPQWYKEYLLNGQQ